MAPTVVTVTGKVLAPDGNPVVGGRIEFELVGNATVDDGGTEQVVGGKKTTFIASDGTVSFTIVPNDGMTPTTTSYRARIFNADGRQVSERTWTITGTGTQDIGDL